MTLYVPNKTVTIINLPGMEIGLGVPSAIPQHNSIPPTNPKTHTMQWCLEQLLHFGVPSDRLQSTPNVFTLSYSEAFHLGGLKHDDTPILLRY